MHGGAFQNPVAVRLAKKDVAGLLDAAQRVAIGAAPNRLRGEQACPLRGARLDLGARLLVPVAAEVSLAADAPIPHGKHCLNVIVAQAAPEELPAEEGRVTHDEIHWRPDRLARLLW